MALANYLSQEVVLRDLGNRLRYLRKIRKLRQLDVEDLGLSYKYYQRLEAGQVNPTLLTLHKLAVAFEVSIGDLLPPPSDHDSL
jgi:transcriptional regulator with XRE-family HTH domain